MILSFIILITSSNSFALSKNQKETIRIAKEVSKFFQVDDLIPAMMGIESSFGKNINSPNETSLGVAQIKPATAKWILEKENVFMSDKKLINLLTFDDEFNIMVACVYLNYLIKETKGDRIKAVLAYNVGINCLKRKGYLYDPMKYLPKLKKYKKIVAGV